MSDEKKKSKIQEIKDLLAEPWRTYKHTQYYGLSVKVLMEILTLEFLLGYLYVYPLVKGLYKDPEFQLSFLVIFFPILYLGMIFIMWLVSECFKAFASSEKDKISFPAICKVLSYEVVIGLGVLIHWIQGHYKNHDVLKWDFFIFLLVMGACVIVNTRWEVYEKNLKARRKSEEDSHEEDDEEAY